MIPAVHYWHEYDHVATLRQHIIRYPNPVRLFVGSRTSAVTG